MSASVGRVAITLNPVLCFIFPVIDVFPCFLQAIATDTDLVTAVTATILVSFSTHKSPLGSCDLHGPITVGAIRRDACCQGTSYISEVVHIR